MWTYIVAMNITVPLIHSICMLVGMMQLRLNLQVVECRFDVFDCDIQVCA
jgi:hypothetical protein